MYFSFRLLFNFKTFSAYKYGRTKLNINIAEVDQSIILNRTPIIFSCFSLKSSVFK